MRFFKKNNTEILTNLEWLRFAVFPMFTIVSIIAILKNFDAAVNIRQKNMLLSIAFGLLIINVLVFYLIHDILRREVQIRKDRLFRERINSEMSLYRQISESYDEQKKREHEYKNQMTVIAALARKHKIDELNEYLAAYDEKIAHKVDLIDTNHVIINAILNTKYHEAKEKGIVFVLKVNDLSQIILSDEDIVVILSNLLNNAIEACEKCVEKLLKVKFVKENGQIIISVINSYAETPLLVGEDYKTTKEDVFMHGIGINNVKDTVTKYKGSCVIKHAAHLFRFIIFIPDNN